MAGTRVTEYPQASTSKALCTAATGASGQPSVTVDGYNGAQMIEVVAVGTVAAQAASLQFEGSYDGTNWYIAGSYQVDAQGTLTRSAASFTLTPGNGTVRHVYQLLDLYKYLRVNITANTLGTGLTASLYAVAV